MSGYFRFPSIHNDNVVFVSEDDLWIVKIDNPILKDAGLKSIFLPIIPKLNVSEI